MRIAFLGDGSLNHTKRWVEYFHQHEHEVLLISFEQVSGCPFPVHQLRKRLPTKLLGYLAALRSVRSELTSFRPHLVNALYVGGYGLIGALSGIRPLVISSLGSDLLVDYPSSVIHRIQIRYAIGKADLITTDGENLSNMVVAMGVPRERILKAYFGIDEHLFHPPSDSHRPDDSKGGEVRIVSTRHLYKIYNIDLLIDSAPAILEKVNATFTICGDGPERTHLERKAATLGVSDRFIFRGTLDPSAIAGELQGASVYVSTSRSDSTSVSLLEAMACGVPPVVTDIPANREWIQDGKNGFLVPLNDPQALAEAVITVIEDRNFSRSVREENLIVVTERGRWRSNMAHVEKAFYELIAAAAR